MNRLFILGNGFDIIHSLKTSYLDFFDFCENYYPGILDELIEYFDHLQIKENWSDFENALSYLNESKMSETLAVSKWGNLEYCLDQIEIYFKAIKENISFLIGEWTYDISENQLNNVRKIFDFQKDDFFISFNYTKILQTVYEISNENIVHIHGKSDDEHNSLIYGHGSYDFYKYTEEVTKFMFSQNNMEYDDEDIVTKKIGKESLSLLKNTNHIIEKYSDELSKVYNQVIVIGHSYSEVDLPYFNKIIKMNFNSKFIFHYNDLKTLNNLESIISNNVGMDYEIVDSETLKILFYK